MYLSSSARRKVRAFAARYPFLRFSLRAALTGLGLVEMVRAQSYFALSRVDRQSLVPDFICVGAHKAGTTWMDRMLRAHPDVAMPRGRKEVHYFTHGFWKGEGWYLWHWRHAASMQMRGEVTPRYTLLDLPRIRHMRTLNPQMKLIFILRNPLERAWSMAVMDLCTDPQIPFAKVPSERFRAHFRSQGSLGRSRYCDTIMRYRSVFDPEQLGLFLYDDLLADPEAFWHEICTFLDIDPDRTNGVDLLRRRENVGGVAPPDKYLPDLRAIHQDEIDQLRPFIGEANARRWLAGARR